MQTSGARKIMNGHSMAALERARKKRNKIQHACTSVLFNCIGKPVLGGSRLPGSSEKSEFYHIILLLLIIKNAPLLLSLYLYAGSDEYINDIILACGMIDGSTLFSLPDNDNTLHQLKGINLQ